MIKNQIFLVPFPFDDFSSTKVRPVICLTNELGFYNHIIVAFITSKTNNLDLNLSILIEKNDSDFNKTGLLCDSAIKIDKIVTIPKSLIIRKLGFLPDKFHNALNNKIKNIFEME
ncbi:MAG: type II toxin-antitoxin system PemK/MazF family toxin [Candidatus Sericytochromatia bacterium]